MYTLFFVEQLETKTDGDGNEYQAYVIGGKEFLPNKVLKVGSQGAFDVILITTDKDSWHRAAKLQPNYIGDNYLEMIIDSFIGYDDPNYTYVGNPNIVRACINVVFDDDTDLDENGDPIRKTWKLGDWINAGQPGTRVTYKKPIKILGVDID